MSPDLRGDKSQIRKSAPTITIPGDGSLPHSSSFSRSSPSSSDVLFPEACARLSRVNSFLDKQVRAALEGVHTSAIISVREDAERMLAHALMLAELRRDLTELRVRSSRLTTPLYVVSSLFLLES